MIAGQSAHAPMCDHVRSSDTSRDYMYLVVKYFSFVAICSLTFSQAIFDTECVMICSPVVLISYTACREQLSV